MSAHKSPAKSGAATVHHGPLPKAKYNLPPVEKQVGGNQCLMDLLSRKGKMNKQSHCIMW